VKPKLPATPTASVSAPAPAGLRRGLAVLLGIVVVLAAFYALRPGQSPVAPAPAAQAPAVAMKSTPVAAKTPPTPATPLNAAPVWKDLTADQRAALTPLQAVWPELASDSKRKWMLMSKNFQQMSPDEQTKLQSRMREWVNLPRQERIEARQNFVATKKVPAELKTQQWEAYQQLSTEEKQKLAAQAPAVRLTPGVAVAKPAQAEKLADVPVIQHPYEKAPEPGFKLAVPSQSVDPKTLLPTAAQVSETPGSLGPTTSTSTH